MYLFSCSFVNYHLFLSALYWVPKALEAVMALAPGLLQWGSSRLSRGGGGSQVHTLPGARQGDFSYCSSQWLWGWPPMLSPPQSAFSPHILALCGLPSIYFFVGGC